MSYRINYHERADGTGVIEYSGDAQGLIDHCAEYARAYREAPKSAQNGWGAGARKILSIDPVVALDVAQRRGMDPFNPDLWKEFLDRDYAKFRCIDDKTLWRRGRR